MPETIPGQNNQPKSIAIIGCGWLGEALALKLLERGYQVYGTTTSHEKRKRLHSLGIQASLYHLGDRNTVLPETDVVVLNIPPSRISDYATKLSHLHALIPGSVAQILYCSTTSVYGNEPGIALESEVPPGMRLPDHMPDEARHGTPRSMLLEAEKVVASDKRTTILRLAGLIGGDRHPVKYLSGRSGIRAPKAPVNITSRNDAIRVIEKLIEMGTTGEVFNVCASEHPTRMEYYTKAAKESGLPLPVFDTNDTTGGKLVDSSRIETHTGLRLREL